MVDSDRLFYDDYKTAGEITRNLIHCKTGKRKRTLDYLIETYLLSKCDSLIGGDNGATQMAIILNGKYEHLKLYQNGYSANFTA